MKKIRCPHCDGVGYVHDDRELGALLKKQRLAANIQQKDLAHAIGISASYLLDLELGRRHWTPEIKKLYLAGLSK